MSDFAALLAGTAVPPLLAEALVLHGKPYRAGPQEPTGQAKYCYHFAWHDPRPYVEGVMQSSPVHTRKIPHAWVLDPFGTAVELVPGIPGASGYVGVRIDRVALESAFPVLARAAAVGQWINPRVPFSEAELARAEKRAADDPDPKRGGVLACAALVGVTVQALVRAGVLPGATRR